MSAELLICLRHAGARLRPAMAAQRDRHPWREKLISRFRWVEPALTVPRRVGPQYRFLMLGIERPNSKVQAVLTELCEAGVPRETIWTLADDTESKYLRFLLRMPRLLIVAFRTTRPKQRLKIADRWSVLGYSLYRDLLCTSKTATPIIISDVSPHLNMLWAAAAKANHKLLWWQDDYHHIHRLPYAVTDAAVLNEAGATAVLQRNPEARIAARPPLERRPIRSVSDRPRIGVAVNASFTASNAELSVLAAVRDALDTKSICLRLHPNSDLHAEHTPKEWLSFAPQMESLANFAARIDLAVVGNSATQLRLLALGVPVVHIAGLDRHGFDLYGYVHNGLCFGAENLAALSVAGVSEHYSSAKFGSILSRLLEVGEDRCLPGLSALSCS